MFWSKSLRKLPFPPLTNHRSELHTDFCLEIQTVSSWYINSFFLGLKTKNFTFSPSIGFCVYCWVSSCLVRVFFLCFVLVVFSSVSSRFPWADGSFSQNFSASAHLICLAYLHLFGVTIKPPVSSDSRLFLNSISQSICSLALCVLHAMSRSLLYFLLVWRFVYIFFLLFYLEIVVWVHLLAKDLISHWTDLNKTLRN